MIAETSLDDRIALMKQVESQTGADENFILISVHKVTGNIRVTNTSFGSFEFMIGLLQKASFQFAIQSAQAARKP